MPFYLFRKRIKPRKPENHSEVRRWYLRKPRPIAKDLGISVKNEQEPRTSTTTNQEQQVLEANEEQRLALPEGTAPSHQKSDSRGSTAKPTKRVVVEFVPGIRVDFCRPIGERPKRPLRVRLWSSKHWAQWFACKPQLA